MKLTKSGKKILETLEQSGKAFTAKQIHAKSDELDLATVYRNLNKLVESGHIRELRVKKGESVYEINSDGHEHAICEKCGKVRHVHIDKTKFKKFFKLADFEVEDVEIYIKGRCKD